MSPSKRIGPYRVGFFSLDQPEPPHVHVKREHKAAKFWLLPVRLAAARGFRAHELAEIQRLLEEHEAELLAMWRGYFDE